MGLRKTFVKRSKCSSSVM